MLRVPNLIDQENEIAGYWHDAVSSEVSQPNEFQQRRHSDKQKLDHGKKKKEAGWRWKNNKYLGISFVIDRNVFSKITPDTNSFACGSVAA